MTAQPRQQSGVVECQTNHENDCSAAGAVCATHAHDGMAASRTRQKAQTILENIPLEIPNLTDRD